MDVKLQYIYGMAFSFWEDQTWLQHRDAIVVGGGIVGLSAAARLAELRPDWSIAVLERSAFGDGGTTRNAGFACFGSPSELLDDRAALGDDAALALVRRRLEGLRTLREWLGDSAIGYAPTGSHAMYVEGGMVPPSVTALADLNRWLRPVTGTESTFVRTGIPEGRGLDTEVVTAIDASPLEGAVHTGMLHRALLSETAARGVDVVRGIHVTHLETGSPSVLTVQRGSEPTPHRIPVPRCLIATNAFARELLPDLDARPAPNRVLVTHPNPALEAATGTYHFEAGYVYARHLPEGRLLIGGGRHWALNPDDTAARLRQFLLDLWPHASPTAYDWTGILGIGSVREPIVQAVSPSTVAAVRLGGMGVAIGAGLGREAADLLAKSR
jgi:glycine/D-amino acid oxidase-like deaminating enzyme